MTPSWGRACGKFDPALRLDCSRFGDAFFPLRQHQGSPTNAVWLRIENRATLYRLSGILTDDDMNIGSKVRLTAVPEGLPNPPDLPTRSVFERCVGRELLVTGVNELGMLELDVAALTGSVGETIWVEPEFLELICE
ncbi:MAG: hypothetical protein H0X25_07535 [Acidobacteriales bacterium]|nr:hypothetical protein [Terriglobales bacterium]